MKQEEKDNIISTIHQVLKPFMLRRLKKDVLSDNVPKKELHVFCPLSELQRSLYSFVIEKNINCLLGIDEKDENVSYIIYFYLFVLSITMNRTNELITSLNLCPSAKVNYIIPPNELWIVGGFYKS